jgi:putative ABC transport system ATP-binding protein
LSAEPSLLLCDEPTGNLDTANTASILELFDVLLADGLTIMMITHDLDVARHTHRRVSIIDGELSEMQPSLQGGPPAASWPT